MLATTCDTTAPMVSVYRGIYVVRDDLMHGGTKARFAGLIFERDERAVVYASPCEGGAQVALAVNAQRCRKKVIIVCAKRKTWHKRTQQAAELGAEIVEIPNMAMYGVVCARAREVARVRGAYLVPFGLNIPEAVGVIRDAARATGLTPDEVWCVASSGTLARGLAEAWPLAHRHVVQTGHAPSLVDVLGATIHKAPHKFSHGVHCSDFPSDPHYDAKGWEVCTKSPHQGQPLFWNVMGY